MKDHDLAMVAMVAIVGLIVMYALSQRQGQGQMWDVVRNPSGRLVSVTPDGGPPVYGRYS